MSRFCLLLAIIFILPVTTAQESIFSLRHPGNESIGEITPWDKYCLDLLKIILKNTEQEYGALPLSAEFGRIKQRRALIELEKNNIDITCAMTSQQRESNSKYQPIRIPLLRGLLSYRIFIIRKEDQKKFSRIQYLDELKKMKAGQGHDWPDYKILQDNSIPVISGGSYRGLFNMLHQKRYDYFPRGVMEPWDELNQNTYSSLTIENNLMFYYPTAFYFFIQKSNKRLHERIEKGLLKLAKNGKLDDFLRQHPYSKSVFEKANLQNRTIFMLKNPVTKETQKVLLNEDFAYQVDSIQLE